MPGDVLQLETKVTEALTIMIGQREKFKCHPGVSGQHMAVQISKVITEGDEER